MAQTTLVPFASLPGCAANCGVLYDVNGACVPPAAPAADVGTYDACFCNDARLAAYSSTSAGACDAACAATPDAAGSIQAWYTGLCGGNNGGVVQTTTTDGTSSTGTSSPNGGGSKNNGGGTWLSTHYQWVIFLVIMVVAIAGIWVGCCIWRRRYLRRKDRQYALGKRLAHATESGRVVPNGGSNAGSVHMPGAGMFQPAPLSAAGIYDEEKLAKKSKKDKKRWTVTQRT
ncbi:hypothetical protein GE09DRAFT_1050726 [Coniochaeta sp. 2T2.1]|nr:hypothetical protein GE09DRAFT_1050726 [Coniochaeta sp. 2T2.1]